MLDDKKKTIFQAYLIKNVPWILLLSKAIFILVTSSYGMSSAVFSSIDHHTAFINGIFIFR